MLRHLPLFAVSASVLALVALPAGCSPAADDGTDSSRDHLDEPAGAIFTSLETVPFKLDAPFAQLIGRFRSGAADPPKPAKDGGADSDGGDEGGAPKPPTVKKPDFSEPGHVVFGGKTFDVKVAIRGNTSPRDCTFPKYSIEFTNKDQVKGTAFQANKKIRVNSHCGDGGPNDRGGQFQRIQNEISPIREEMVYRLIRASGTPTYRTRLAKISYTDTSAASPLPAMEHHGLVIESGDDAAKRFAAAGLIDKTRGIYMNDPTGQPQFAGAEVSKMKPDDVANVYLAEAMSSNVDWVFEEGRFGGGESSFWNVDVFGVPHEATQLPIPQDFDLASAVHLLRDPSTEVPSQMRLFHDLASAQPDIAKAAAARFKAKKAAIVGELAALEKAGVSAGRLPSTDQVTTTDPGFVAAHKALDIFFALPELQ